MSITTRITAYILLLSMLTAAVSWVAVHRLVIRPFADEVHETWLREVAFIGRELDRGVRPRKLAEELGVRIHPLRRPVPERWKTRQLAGQELVVGDARRNLVILKTDRGPLVVRRDLDLGRPGRRLPPVLGLVALLVFALALYIARRSVRPLRTTTLAMSRMEKGDLAHRLPEDGPLELAAASRAFNGLADRVQALLATERQLLAGISHELRTPLTRLRLEVELLRDAGVAERRLDRMEGDLTQLDDLIGEALELSRLQLGSAPLQRESLDLRELVAAFEDAQLVGPPTPFEGDRFLLQRAVGNLVENARKYAPESPVTITVGPTYIEVRDEGPGVPEAELDQLFEPFYRTKQGSRRADGHGLGLMLVRTVVELHGGEVVARNGAPGLAIRMVFSH